MTSRGITHCTHMIWQRCRERIIARFLLTSAGWLSFISRGGARTMLARLGRIDPSRTMDIFLGAPDEAMHIIAQRGSRAEVSKSAAIVLPS
jgi:hypothetical protein